MFPLGKEFDFEAVYLSWPGSKYFIAFIEHGFRLSFVSNAAFDPPESQDARKYHRACYNEENDLSSYSPRLPRRRRDLFNVIKPPENVDLQQNRLPTCQAP